MAAAEEKKNSHENRESKRGPGGRKRTGSGLPDVLADVQAAGYDGIEIGAQHLDITQPAPFRQLLADHDLAVAGIHVGGEIWNPQAVRDALPGCGRQWRLLRRSARPTSACGAMKQSKSDEELAQAAENLNHVGELAAATACAWPTTTTFGRSRPIAASCAICAITPTR